jgi:hypothetical protein
VDLVLLSDVVGWIGAGCLLGAYALLSAGRINAGLTYQLLNLAGSVGLAINGVTHGAWPSTALNVVWLAVALVALRGLARNATRAGPSARRQEPADNDGAE